MNGAYYHHWFVFFSHRRIAWYGHLQHICWRLVNNPWRPFIDVNYFDDVNWLMEGMSHCLESFDWRVIIDIFWGSTGGFVFRSSKSLIKERLLMNETPTSCCNWIMCEGTSLTREVKIAFIYWYNCILEACFNHLNFIWLIQLLDSVSLFPCVSNRLLCIDISNWLFKCIFALSISQLWPTNDLICTRYVCMFKVSTSKR